MATDKIWQAYEQTEECVTVLARADTAEEAFAEARRRRTCRDSAVGVTRHAAPRDYARRRRAYLDRWVIKAATRDERTRERRARFEGTL